LTRVYLEHRATWPGLLATARSPQCVWHARDAEPARLWPLYATITLSLDRMSAGILPAVGMLASRSSLIDDGELGPDAAHTATAVRSVLATESRLDHVLARPLHVAETHTGTPGQSTNAAQARKRSQGGYGKFSQQMPRETRAFPCPTRVGDTSPVLWRSRMRLRLPGRCSETWRVRARSHADQHAMTERGRGSVQQCRAKPLEPKRSRGVVRTVGDQASSANPTSPRSGPAGRGKRCQHGKVRPQVVVLGSGGPAR
jgi:hypothetical protein